MNIVDPFQEKIVNAKALDFGIIFNQSIELFKKVWLQGLFTILITFALIVPFLLIFFLAFFYFGFESSLEFDTWRGAKPLAIAFLICCYLFLIVLISVVGFALKAAFYRICKNIDLNNNEPDDYFYYLKGPYLGKTIKISLAYIGISILAVLMCVLPVIYAVVPLSLMIVVYSINPDLSISDIIKISFNLGHKKWLLTFGLIIIAGILAEIVGLLMCIIGIFVTASFAMIPVYFIYKEVIGVNNDHEIR